ncbi:MAG: PAS domain S-box protein [Deltaproteobacteria bacterium]|nr:MAG: PAS domain S-box protein [Deltaproteobacteria bacterium]
MTTLDDLLAGLDGPVVAALGRSGYGVVVTIDRGDGPQIVHANDAAVAILGYAAADLAARPALDHLVQDDRTRVEEMVRLARAGEVVPSPIEIGIVRKSGERAVVEVGATVVPVAEGTASVAFFRDVSERRALRSRLALADRMATVGTVAAGVAHEINNPLTYVLLNLDRMASALDAITGPPHAVDRLRDALAHARDGAQRVRSIVSDLRSFSRASEDTADIDVRRVVRSAVNIAGNTIRERARLVEALDETPPVRASESRLGQVFLNLLVNAAQAIAPGAPDRNLVRVSTRFDGHRIVVEVADSGCGMPPAILRRAFDPFFTTKPIGVGTGLGLSICHKIVTSLGGEIEAESRDGAGSVFRVYLPRA